ncbi:uncharacterized protein LOC130818609 [Amaranthus tricolor]|uniref:uncharacterized protein LOC130818609 n=1 Tax=Amaranthus tricolor TaxID=29722 RepID=UPI00258547D9|nr:uncharacterized protein LOC130818609 [Amaranthus tricolor]
MPPFLRKNENRGDSDRILRNLVKALAGARNPRQKSLEERASSISKRIAQSKPSTYDGKGQPFTLENWLREFDKLFSVVRCPAEFMVDQAAFYLVEDADYWWTHSKARLIVENDGEFSWEHFKGALRNQFYPPHFCPEDVPIETKKMQRFELGLSYEIQKHIETDRKEQEKLAHSGDKRREPMFQNAESGSNHAQNHFKKHKTYGGYQEKVYQPGQSSKGGRGSTSEVRVQKPLYGRNGKERIYNCRRCQKNHPGRDCRGALVDCSYCGKSGHRMYECYARLGQQEPQGGESQRFSTTTLR